MFNPYFSSPAQATALYLFKNHTPSPSEIAAQSTYVALQANLATQWNIEKMTGVPTYQQPSFLVNSEADLPKVLYNDVPMYTEDSVFPCLSAKNPGPPLLVHSLDLKMPDYYIVPFYKDNKVCDLVMIHVINGIGTVDGIGGVFGDLYPQITANEATNLVEQKTGLKVIGQPVLAYQLIYEDTDPFTPFWKLQTADGETYYVIFMVGPSENGSINKHVIVINSRDATLLH